MENDEIRVIPEEQPVAPQQEEPSPDVVVEKEEEKKEIVETIEEEKPVVGEVRPRDSDSPMDDQEKEMEKEMEKETEEDEEPVSQILSKHISPFSLKTQQAFFSLWRTSVLFSRSKAKRH
jgi:hypothetical protein